MATEITLSIPDDTYRRAERLAGLIGKNVSDILTDTLSISLPQMSSTLDENRIVSELPDPEVIALSESQIDPVSSMRFSELLEKQQSTQINPDEAAELLAFMQVYQDGLLRKAQALNESVKRGLRGSLEP